MAKKYNRRKPVKKSSKKKFLQTFLLLVILSGIGVLGLAYYAIFASNINKNSEDLVVTLKEDITFCELVDTLKSDDILRNYKTFSLLAKYKGLSRIKRGRYKLEANMGNNDIINRLKSGGLYPVKITFNNIRTKKELVHQLTKDLAIEAEELLQLLNDGKFLFEYGLSPETAVSIFLPNTYEVYWTISADGLFLKMQNEYNKFWNASRKDKAKAMGLSLCEVSTLASIVEEEVMYQEEASRVAGLYMNRLKRGMLLQADPTVKFAVEDFSLRRVLKVHTQVESPYNTYKNKGLPPGPIRVPSIEIIDAVLNYEHHDYLYMCASANFSGKHSFAKSLREHNKNAQKYHQELNKRKIYQ